MKKLNIKCDNCKKISTSKEWTFQTIMYVKRNEINTNITPLKKTIRQDEEYSYICPKCGELTLNQDMTILD